MQEKIIYDWHGLRIPPWHFMRILPPSEVQLSEGEWPCFIWRLKNRKTGNRKQSSI